ncbi:MAG TPA: sialidase family protein [Kofleriaceae bacterium]|nr:sialidase family protein [Kofleriaceae bacterium]
MRIVALVWLAACGDNTHYAYDSLVDVSGYSPYHYGCGDTAVPPSNVPFPGLEVEPSLAADPTNDAHLVGAWQQNRWSSGGSDGTETAVSFDAGKTWTRALPKLSTCAGGDYSRTSDPWVTIGGDGTTYVSSIGFDSTTSRSAVLAASSSDGGKTWSEPAALIADDDPDVFNDKDSITADPFQPGVVYATWDRLTGQTKAAGLQSGPAMFARLIDGTWEAARSIYDPGTNAQTLGNIIVVPRDGTLVDVFIAFHGGLSQDVIADMPTTDIQVIRSSDGGTTWSAPIEVASQSSVGVPDERTGDGLPEIAVDRTSGAIYVAWEDSSFSNNDHDGIVVARSTDGGLTWSALVQANGAPDVPAFTPQIAVASDGTVGVFYYDLRDDGHATAWLATSRDGGATWSDEQLSGPFDQTIANVGADGAFLGDYEGLAARGTDLVPLFAIAFIPEDPTDIFVRP